jgi:hypothetical protein
MNWIPLTSTAIRAARYLQPESILDVEFCNGTIYRYQAVPETTFEQLLQAESKGRFFNLRVRPKFVFEPLRSTA